MKTSVFIFFALCLFFSCQRTGDNRTSGRNDAMQTWVDTTPTATAIFWVDKNGEKLKPKGNAPISIKRAKAKVDIDSTGKVTILSYVKPQDENVKKYLEQRMEIFRVSKVMLDSGYVKPGVQYVQLKYLPERMQKSH